MLGLIGSIAGIAALIVTFGKLDHLNEDVQTKIFVFELSLVVVLLFGYIAVISFKKLHRFAQAVFYIHYINHIVRDEIASMEAGEPIDLKEVLQDIVDAAANCFSLLSGKRCRCQIHEIDPHQNVFVLVRDRMTQTTRPETEPPYHIADNTDFSSLWYGSNGCPRFFLSRNIVDLWSKNKYKSTAFQTFGDPETISLMGITFVTKWTLPFRSAMVVPIRYVPESSDWPALNEANLSRMSSEDRPFVWGFFSVDSKSRRSFDMQHAPELAAAIADATFTLLHFARMNARLPSVD
ncbi:MAG TPA: hypothetical protein VK591_20245 [Xanthobacteraceae bacterium]|nr:hypothetical protein [Xanthobacteraceae bacterium]